MTTFVLIPGAGGVGWLWHRVEAELRRRGFDAISIDLPADDPSAGLGDYRDVVIDLVGDRSGLVVVGQSMGALTAALVADRVPVDLLVLFAAMIPSPGETPGEWWASTGHQEAMRAMAEREGRTWSEEFDAVEMFLNGVPQELAAESEHHQREQSGTPFGEPWPLVAWPDVPTKVLLGRDDRFFPADFLRRLSIERLGIVPDEVDGGHLANLSHPRELADILISYAAQIAKA